MIDTTIFGRGRSTGLHLRLYMSEVAPKTSDIIVYDVQSYSRTDCCAYGEVNKTLAVLRDQQRLELGGVSGTLQLAEVAAHWDERPRPERYGTMAVAPERWAEFLAQFIRPEAWQ